VDVSLYTFEIARRHLLRENILCYNLIFPLLPCKLWPRARTYAYSANSKIGENYYALPRRIELKNSVFVTMLEDLSLSVQS
jgi:hypothetical protein